MRDDANRTVNGLHVLHASRTRKKRTATTGLPVGTIGTRKKWGVNIDPHMDPFTAPLRPSYPIAKRQVKSILNLSEVQVRAFTGFRR